MKNLYLRTGLCLLLLMIVSACGTAQPETVTVVETVVVEKEVEKEVKVVETVEVEKEVKVVETVEVEKVVEVEKEGGAVLNVWWNKGYYASEDEAIEKVVADWEAKTGNTVKFSFFTNEDIIKKAQSAIEADFVPDIVFGHQNDWVLSPRLAWEDKLANVSDVIEPVADLYSEGALNAVNLQNNVTGERSYYAVPIEQQTTHIFYWKDMLAEIGKSEADIPKEWDAFWDFWKEAQDLYREKTGEKVYGIGMPMSTGASDTYFQFELILDAYNAKLLNADGKLLLDDPATRANIIDALTFMTDMYIEGYVPPGAVNWLDSDNNADFLGKSSIMSPNPSLSIPASQREDNKENYYDLLGTAEFPDKPDGGPIRYPVSVKQALIFKDAENVDLAKDFLSYIIQPENLGPYVQGSLGRWFPVMPSLLEDDFWRDPADPHISVAMRQFSERPTRPFYHIANPAYSGVQAENVWAKAIGRVVVEGWTVEDAADEAIERVQQVFADWEAEAAAAK